MCNWRRWVWPGILATVILTALAMFFQSANIEGDLTAKAGSALQAENPWATVELDGRDLTLNGVAPSEEAAAAALLTADNAYDVRIANNATTLPPIASPYPFNAIKNADGITLTGNYPSDTVRAEIVAAAETAMPGVAVTDEMTLARGAPAGFAALAGLGLSQLGNLTDGEASLSDTNYSIKGSAADPAAYEAELARANGDLPEGGALAMADITAPAVTPYIWSAEKTADNAIVLNGFAPSIDERAAVEAAAIAENPGATVTNNLQIASGAPAGYAALTALGVSQLGDFDLGQSSLSDNAYSISGTAKTPELFAGAVDAANNALPDGGTLAMADITPPTVSPYTWNAAKDTDNTITLTGFAPSIAERAAVEAAAKAANPEATVVNELQIAAGAPASYGDMTAFGLGQLNDLTNGTASLADADYAITGAAKTSAAYDSSRSAANGDLPGGTLANAAITPPAAEGAYNWAATKGPDGSITLTGLMPTPADRDRIAARAAELNPGVSINNQMQIASGAPDGFVDGAEYSLGYLPRFTAGTVNMSNLDLNVQGRAADAGNYELANALNSDVPAGIQLAESITLPQATGPYEVVATRSAEVITLQGYAPSTAEKAQIAAAAGEFGLPVVDRIEVAGGAPEGIEWGAAASSVVAGLKDASAGTATIRGNAASVDADLAPNTVGIEEASSAFTASMADGVDAQTVSYRLPRISPYVWQATRVENVTIAGYVPSREVGDKAVAEAGSLFPGAEIIDQQQLASGESRGLESAISVGLATVSRLEDGRAEISDNTLSVTGVALTQPAKIDIERKVINGVPPGFTGVANISVKPAPLETGGLGALTPNLCQLQLNNTLEGGINFENDRAEIAETSFGVLDQLAYTAQQCPDAAIEIGGHTDSDGSEEYNQNLSERRASEVANYLIASGVSSSRLTPVGYGEGSPIASNDTEEGQARNRRIEFKIAQ